MEGACYTYPPYSKEHYSQLTTSKWKKQRGQSKYNEIT
jgi:hypothetical protein